MDADQVTSPLQNHRFLYKVLLVLSKMFAFICFLVKITTPFSNREQANARLCEDYEMLTRMVDSEENFLEV